MLAAIAVLLTCVSLSSAASNLTLYAVAVGQGDCNIIQCPNGKDILIVDMGAKDTQYASHEYVTNLLKTKFQAASSGKRIHMVISHSHIDHYNYITAVMDDDLVANVQEIILGDTFAHYSTSFQNWLTDKLPNSVYTVNDEDKCFGNDNCKPTPVSGLLGGSPTHTKMAAVDPWQFCGDDVKISVLGANIGTTPNSRSIVLRLVYNQWSLFMAGDFEMVTPQKELISQYPNGEMKSTYYKVAHHGAWTTTKQPNLPLLLAEIQPQSAYMSQAYPNCSQFHHPNCQTIKNLEAIGSIGKINANLNSPFVCWDGTRVVVQNGMGLAMYQTCRSYSASGQVCQDVWVEADGRYDTTRYIDVPAMYVSGRDVGTEDGNMESWE